MLSMGYYTCLVVLITLIHLTLSEQMNAADEYESLSSIAEFVNRRNSTWQASRRTDSSRFSVLSKAAAGMQPKDPYRLLMPVRRRRIPEDIEIPDEFDARQFWNFCPTIKEIAEQGNCASCWAIATTDVMSDRICIHSGGREIVRLSAGNLLSCCTNCGKGCRGGYPGGSWIHWVKKGIVTGGFYYSDYGCQRYPIRPCSNPAGGDPSSRRNCNQQLQDPTPRCRKKCHRDSEAIYNQDLYFGEDVYRIPNRVEAIQWEIMLNGPVQATLRIYDDLLTYRKGVYQHVEGAAKEFHAVKILGWGDDNGIPYWLCANIWGTRWGENGFFRILRGSDQVGIESNVMAGMPKLSHLDRDSDDNNLDYTDEWIDDTDK